MIKENLLKSIIFKPGIKFGELCKLAGVSKPTATRYLKPLIRSRVVLVKRVGRAHLLYPNYFHPLIAGYMHAFYTEEGMKRASELGLLEFEILSLDMFFKIKSIVIFGSMKRDIDVAIWMEKTEREDLRKIAKIFNKVNPRVELSIVKRGDALFEVVLKEGIPIPTVFDSLLDGSVANFVREKIDRETKVYRSLASDLSRLLTRNLRSDVYRIKKLEKKLEEVIFWED